MMFTVADLQIFYVQFDVASLIFV